MESNRNENQLKLDVNNKGRIRLSRNNSQSEQNEKEINSNSLESPIKKVPILFRNSVPEVPTTTHGAFALYRYPAKFIPQVIAYILKKYAKPNMRIFDPFAGYGTVGVVSRIYGHEYELWDLNPLTEVIHNTILTKQITLDVPEIINGIKKSNEDFIPEWSNLHYWFPEEFLSLLSQSWGYIHSLPNEIKKLLFIPMINVTRYFSWCDEKTHKLYKSKYAKKKVSELLQKNWKSAFYIMLKKEIRLLLKKLAEYTHLNPQLVNFKIKTGIDALETNLDDDVNILLTSPPYLQAQEYIRSTKLALYWLGFNDLYVRSLTKKEIPYRPVDKIKVHSDLFHSCREKIETEKLKTLYDRYFYSILNIFTSLAERVNDYFCIFIGPAAIRTVPVPIDDIIVEHLQTCGWEHEITYIDTIVSRVMFQSKTNPATGLKDKRIKTEHLAVLKKEK